MSLIFVHEMGHFLTSKLLKWKTDKICIYPLGGVTVLNDDINKSLKEEFLIVIMGPIFQMIFYRHEALHGLQKSFRALAGTVQQPCCEQQYIQLHYKR